MRYPSIHSVLFRLFGGSPVKLSHLLIAAALSSSLFALRPALAAEEGDGSLFRVPGEGPPYSPYYAPRSGWPPMPLRSPYSHGRRDDGYDRDVQYFPAKNVFERYPAKEKSFEVPYYPPIKRDYEERDEGHAPQYQAKSDGYRGDGDAPLYKAKIDGYRDDGDTPPKAMVTAVTAMLRHIRPRSRVTASTATRADLTRTTIPAAAEERVTAMAGFFPSANQMTIPAP